MSYNKLVRDNIPDIIMSDGRTPHTRVLSEDECQSYLEEKLIEEVHEYLESKQIEELADILEVVYAISEIKNCTQSKLETIREQKKIKNGGFKKRVLLYDITSD